MMKRTFSITVLIGATACAMAQTTPAPSSQPYQGAAASTPTPAYTPPQASAYNQAATGGVLFTNRLGQTFSAQDLVSQLQNLRAAVDQAVPILTAFNESYSNSNNGGRQTVGGALSGIVSDVLHRNQASSQTVTGQGSTSSNLLSILHGLLNTNSTTVTSATPNPQDLISLQTDLQPVISVLQRLNVNGPSNQITAPYPNTGYTPTGR